MATTTTVPGKFDVGLDGRGFMIDTQYLEGYRSQTLEPIRRQADSSGTVGESSLNPEGYWRRSPESWHKGAGQARYDASDSDPEQFFTSVGVDVSTEGQLSLLKTVTDEGVAPTLVGSTIGETVEVGGRFVTIEPGGSTKLYVYHTSFSVVSAVATTGSDVTAIASDDNSTLYYVDNNILYSDSIFTLETGTGSPTTLLGGDTTIAGVNFVGGRLLCTDTAGEVYDISALPGALPASLGSLGGGSSTNFNAAYANGYIYLSADFRQDIMKTTVKADGSGLEVLTVAITLPTNEWSFRLHGYLDFVLSVTTKGVRLGVSGNDGTLTVGSNFAPGLPTTGYGIVTQGEFVYLPGYNNPHPFTSDGGLLAINLSVINDALVPAHFAHIALTGGATPRFVWGVNAGSFYMLEGDGTLWSSDGGNGYLTSGQIGMGDVSFGTREPKLFLDPVETAADGTVTHTFTLPDGSTVINGNTATAVPSVSWQMTLGPDVAGDDMTVQYPILRALPVPAYIEIETVPVLLHDHVVDRNGQDTAVDTDAQLDYLRGLRDGGTLIDYQDGRRTRSAQVIGVDRIPAQRDSGGYQWQGTAVVRMKVLQ